MLRIEIPTRLLVAVVAIVAVLTVGAIYGLELRTDLENSFVRF